jgi:dipeptidyl aminopeptidase/acylaminoacyl peptidase
MSFGAAVGVRPDPTGAPVAVGTYSPAVSPRSAVSASRPYGSWSSPVTSELLVQEVVRLSDVTVAGDEVWWNEGRPAEAGRQVLVVGGAGRPPADRVPPDFSARTAVHEYGGGSYAVLPGPAGAASSVIFANWADQRLWLAPPDGTPRAVTPSPDVARGDRFADLALAGPAGAAPRWLLAVRERHGADSAGGKGVDNDLIALDLAPALAGSDPREPGPAISVLASGRDFYSSPRPSPDGTRVAWITWDHPSMPWDSTELWVAALDDGGASSHPRLVAGGPGESVGQPRWSPDGRLHYLSDRSGWWNLYDEAGRPLAPLDAEFADPDWQLGQSSYAFLADGRLVATWSTPGGARLGVVDDGAVLPLDLPFSVFSSVRAQGGAVVAVAGSPTSEPAVVRIGIDDGRVEVVRPSRAGALDAAWISVPQPVEFPTESGRTAHALWYPPTNPETVGPAAELPPLIVVSHGGPTSSASPVLNYGIQYWTSRGLGVVDVDYGGSSGYGRAYRQRLQGLWGIVDVDDCVAAARWLAGQGLVDPARLVIRGGSAGGYTTLAALAFRDVFAAGASHYGVADPALLARDTHKFESRYLDGLIGPYPAAAAVYEARSPLHHVDQLDRPLILFQGLEDAIVPPAQAELIASALAARGVPVAHLTFAGEQHGFRQATTIRRVIDTELDFFGRVLGFTPHDRAEAFVIVNEDGLPSH